LNDAISNDNESSDFVHTTQVGYVKC